MYTLNPKKTLSGSACFEESKQILRKYSQRKLSNNWNEKNFTSFIMIIVKNRVSYTSTSISRLFKYLAKSYMILRKTLMFYYAPGFGCAQKLDSATQRIKLIQFDLWFAIKRGLKPLQMNRRWWNTANGISQTRMHQVRKLRKQNHRHRGY